MVIGENTKLWGDGVRRETNAESDVEINSQEQDDFEEGLGM